ncbi:MAG: OmpA family protein [Spirochaetota bacterium]
MAGSLSVLVDNKELVPITRLREGESGVLNLTTMLPDQNQAYIEIYFKNGRRRGHIQTFHVNRLRHGKERPQIVVSAHIREQRATVTLRIDGELIATESYPIPAEMLSGRPWPWLAAAAAIALVAVIGWGAWSLARGEWSIAGSAPADSRAGNAADASGEPAAETRDGPDTASAPEQEAEPARAVAPEGDTEPDTETDTEPEPSTTTESEARAQDGDEEPADAPPATRAEAIVYFEPESAVLRAATKEELNLVAAGIAQWIGAGGDPETVTIVAEGHTALYDTEASRLELSRERAAAVADYLSDALNERGIGRPEIETSGRGGQEPVTRTESEQWRNRRVELTITGG